MNAALLKFHLYLYHYLKAKIEQKETRVRVDQLRKRLLEQPQMKKKDKCFMSFRRFKN